MSFKKIMSLGLAALMTVSLAACGGGSSSASNAAEPAAEEAPAEEAAAEEAPAEEAAAEPAAAGPKGANEDPANTNTSDETLKVILASEPSSLWGAPSAKTENESQIINAALLDTLVLVDHATGDVVPNLATAWEWVDGTHCKFTLRDDVTMTDGTPLVADDVVYTVGIWTQYSPSNDTGRFVAGAVADDEHTVTIEFNVEAPDLLAMMAWSNFGIVSEDEVNAAGGLEKIESNPVMGSGKYKFVEWKSGQYIKLERNDNYWNKDWKGYFKDIQITFTSDAAARAMAVQSGDADIAYDMPVAQAAPFIGNPDVGTIVYSFGQVAHLWYNMGKNAKATKEAKVREAIDKALDFNALAGVGTAGLAQPVLGYFPEDGKYYNQTYTEEERAVDIEGAKALMEEAGYGSGVDLKILGTQEATPLYTVIQENLRAIGINLTIDTPDVPTFVQQAFGDGDYDLIMVGELTDARYPTLLPFLVKANIESGFVIGGPKWTTDEIDAAITEAIKETDEAKAKEELGALEQTMKEQFIVSNLYPELKSSVINKDLKGYTTRERGFMDLTNFYK